MHDSLSRASQSHALAIKYQRELAVRLERYPLGEWAEVRVYGFALEDMAMAATTTLAGPRFIKLNPDFLETLWDFGRVAASIVWGLPRWLNAAAYRKRDRLHDACARYLASAWADFDWDGPDADADWEPIFGSRYARQLIRWFKEAGFDDKSIAGGPAILLVFG